MNQIEEARAREHHQHLALPGFQIDSLPLVVLEKTMQLLRRWKLGLSLARLSDHLSIHVEHANPGDLLGELELESFDDGIEPVGAAYLRRGRGLREGGFLAPGFARRFIPNNLVIDEEIGGDRLRKQREREQGAAADRHLNPNLRTLSTRPHARVYLDIIFPRGLFPCACFVF